MNPHKRLKPLGGLQPGASPSLPGSYGHPSMKGVDVPVDPRALHGRPLKIVPMNASYSPDFSGLWRANTSAYWDLLTHDARPIVAQRGAYPDVPVLAAPVVALGTIGWISAGVGVVDGDEIPYQPGPRRGKKRTSQTGSTGIRRSGAIFLAFRAPCTCPTRFRSCKARRKS